MHNNYAQYHVIFTLLFHRINFIRLPFAEPWLHVTYFFLGGYIGQKWVNLEKQLVLDINEIRADKGMAPMVATDAMLGLKYKTQE